jgi:hypothetical protein
MSDEASLDRNFKINRIITTQVPQKKEIVCKRKKALLLCHVRNDKLPIMFSPQVVQGAKPVPASASIR